MSDVNLLIFGCIVMFTAYAGAYVAIRERFVHGTEEVAKPRARRPRKRRSHAA